MEIAFFFSVLCNKLCVRTSKQISVIDIHWIRWCPSSSHFRHQAMLHRGHSIRESIETECLWPRNPATYLHGFPTGCLARRISKKCQLDLLKGNITISFSVLFLRASRTQCTDENAEGKKTKEARSNTYNGHHVLVVNSRGGTFSTNS